MAQPHPTASPGIPADSAETADYGFENVPREEKRRLVRHVFDRVAPRYDLMNDLMSLGVHRLWKAHLVDLVRPRPGEVLLDLAGGTGDVAQRLFTAAQNKAQIVLCDINEAMVREGRDRALDRGETWALDRGSLDQGDVAQGTPDQTARPGISLLCGNAEALPFADASFDAYTIAFGLRNVTDKGKALAEARRVLKPGGRFFCLEFSPLTNPLLGKAYDVYSFSVLPRLGRIFAGDGEPYAYLAESIRRFPDRATLAAMMETAGLGAVKIRPLSGGIVIIHSAWRT